MHRRVRVGGPRGGRRRGRRGGGGGDDDDRRAGRVVPGRVGEAGEDEHIEDGEGGRFRLRTWREFSIDVIVLSSLFCAVSRRYKASI